MVELKREKKGPTADACSSSGRWATVHGYTEKPVLLDVCTVILGDIKMGVGQPNRVIGQLFGIFKKFGLRHPLAPEVTLAPCGWYKENNAHRLVGLCF